MRAGQFWKIGVFGNCPLTSYLGFVGLTGSGSFAQYAVENSIFSKNGDCISSSSSFFLRHRLPAGRGASREFAR